MALFCGDLLVASAYLVELKSNVVRFQIFWGAASETQENSVE